MASIMETQEAQGRQDELSLGQEVPKRTIRIQSQRPDQETTVSSTQGAPHRVHQLGLHGRSLRGPGQRLSEGEMRVSWPQDFDFSASPIGQFESSVNNDWKASSTANELVKC